MPRNYTRCKIWSCSEYNFHDQNVFLVINCLMNFFQQQFQLGISIGAEEKINLAFAAPYKNLKLFFELIFR